MMRYIVIIFLFISCKKSNVSNVNETVKYDSIISQYVKSYFIDLNKDNVNDIAIQWSYAPLQEKLTTYKTWTLNNNVLIHSVQQTQPICKDTTYYQSFYTTIESNCNTGGIPIRTDNFVATPNLDHSNLSSSIVNSQSGDTILIYKKIEFLAMPSPNGNSLDLEYGFFNNKDSGFLLFEVNAKRYGLHIDRFPEPLSLNKVIKIDP